MESLSPIHHRGIKMGMRDRYRADTTQLLDCGDGIVIQKANAVPEHIALLRLNQQCPLGDSKGRFSTNAYETWFELPQRVVKAILLHSSESRPYLLCISKKLALVEANRTSLRRCLALCKLVAT